MAKVPATVVMVTPAGVVPAIEPQIDAPCVMQKSACRVPTPTADDHPHHVAPTVAPVRPGMGFAQTTGITVTPVA
jgi:hypothetical protein